MYLMSRMAQFIHNYSSIIIPVNVAIYGCLTSMLDDNDNQYFDRCRRHKSWFRYNTDIQCDIKFLV